MKVAPGVVISGLDIGAVAITDREKLVALPLATIVYRANPFHPGYTLKAIGNRRWFMPLAATEVPYRCSLHPRAKLGSTLK